MDSFSHSPLGLVAKGHLAARKAARLKPNGKEDWIELSVSLMQGINSDFHTREGTAGDDPQIRKRDSELQGTKGI